MKRKGYFGFWCLKASAFHASRHLPRSVVRHCADMNLGLKGRVQGSVLVKYKARAFKMGVAANIEVFQNALIELVNVCYASFLHEKWQFLRSECPAVQKLTTVLSCRPSRGFSTAYGNSVNLSMRLSTACLKTPGPPP
jgi:hypothetical protein